MRARVRVVDFFPPDLEDFAQCLDDLDYNDVAGEDVTMEDSQFEIMTPRDRWEWCFYLRVEDARPMPGVEPLRMNILVHGDDAVYLLGLDATEYVFPLLHTLPHSHPTCCHSTLLHVHTRQASDWLQNSLRANLQMKSLLENKLWTLWGDLAERKLEPDWNDNVKPQSHPFECCIDEYGVEENGDGRGGWKRMFRLKQTVIRDR